MWDTGVTKTYSPNNLNQYTAAEGYTVTNNNEHQISLYQGVTYGYINDEHFNYAAAGPNSYYVYYDALGRCVKRILNDSTGSYTGYYIYDGEKPILEYSASGQIYGRNVYGKGIDEILMRTDYNLIPANPYYYQQDHEGSVTHLTDSSGTVIEKYRYDAFGAPFYYDGSDVQIGGSNYDNRFLFTGREFLGAWYECRARIYHPTLGRFTSEDPKLFDAGDYNLFRYCHNDPEDLTDPMGLWPVPPAGEAPPPPPQWQSPPQNPLNRPSGTGYSIDKWGPPGSFGRQNSILAQLQKGQSTAESSSASGRPATVTRSLRSPTVYSDGKEPLVIIKSKYVFKDESGDPVGRGIAVKEAASVSNVKDAPSKVEIYHGTRYTDSAGSVPDRYRVPFFSPEGHVTITQTLFSRGVSAQFNTTVYANGHYEVDTYTAPFH